MKRRLFIGLISLFMALGLTSCASDGKTPYIGDNGNWWIGDTDLGVPAKGEDGKDGIDGKDGKDGTNGSSITVSSVEKTGSNGLIDTYTITFSDGTKTTFTVTNGESSVIENIECTKTEGLVDTYTITFTNGSSKTFTVTNGQDGENLTIESIELKSSEGLIDTYEIKYSDGSKFEFVVSNGADGETPYIGNNGNWWIGEKDTGVLADYEKANNVPLTDYSNGLTYITTTIEGKTGYVVSSWDSDLFSEYIYYKYLNQGISQSEIANYVTNVNNGINLGHLVIPNYIGSVPVIGVSKNIKLNFNKVTLSRNTIWIGASAFEGCSNLTYIDFNNCGLKQIQEKTFKETSLTTVSLPSSVTFIGNYAFSSVSLTNIDLSNIKYIGNYAFDSLVADNGVYLSKTIEYVGDCAFKSSFVYIEHESIPASWSGCITSSSSFNSVVTTNCKKNSDYVYSVEDNFVAVCQYIGNNTKIIIPDEIDNKPVTKIGRGFEMSVALQYSVLDYESLLELFPNKEIVLSSNVTDIEAFAFYGINLTIFASSSLQRISKTLLMGLNDRDDIAAIKLNNKYVCAQTNYLAFAGNDLPQVIDLSGNIDTSYTKEIIESSLYRVGFNINYSAVESDSLFYYLNNVDNYSILSHKAFTTQNLLIPSTFNGKPVTTILSKAIGLESEIKSIVIENGIEKIRPLAILCYDTKYITIPLSVNLINEKGILVQNGNPMIYVYASSKPIDWDSNWTNKLTDVVYGVDGEIKQNNFFLYSADETAVTLLLYLGSSSNIYIPNTLDNLPVTSIKSNFFASNYRAAIYIPSSITVIEENAFINKAYNKFTFYCEASAKGSNWEPYWYSKNTSYANFYYSQTDSFNYIFSGEYVYSLLEGNATLLSYSSNSGSIYIPRTIDDNPITSIKEFCFYLDEAESIYLPNSISTIENYAIDIYRSNSYCQIYTDAPSKLSGWGSYYIDNSLSSRSYINYNYGCILNY